MFIDIRINAKSYFHVQSGLVPYFLADFLTFNSIVDLIYLLFAESLIQHALRHPYLLPLQIIIYTTLWTLYCSRSRLSKSLVIFAWHIKHEMIVNVAIYSAYFVSQGANLLKTDWVISTMLHYDLRMLFEVLLVCAWIFISLIHRDFRVESRWQLHFCLRSDWLIQWNINIL